jgi:hypothetical protein
MTHTADGCNRKDSAIYKGVSTFPVDKSYSIYDKIEFQTYLMYFELLNTSPLPINAPTP